MNPYQSLLGALGGGGGAPGGAAPPPPPPTVGSATGAPPPTMTGAASMGAGAGAAQGLDSKASASQAILALRALRNQPEFAPLGSMIDGITAAIQKQANPAAAKPAAPAPSGMPPPPPVDSGPPPEPPSVA